MRPSDAVIDDPGHWDKEYNAQGIPSSWKADPSSVVTWALANLTWTGHNITDGLALDVGCGTGRNTIALARDLPIKALGIDYSRHAIEKAKARLASSEPSINDRCDFQVADTRESLPLADGTASLVLDIFVYFHLLDHERRSSYRRELARVMRSDGRLILSLAGADDGYYSTCPPAEDWKSRSGIPIVVDTHACIGNIMHTIPSLIEEFSDCFVLDMIWRKRAIGPMHGGNYSRVTLASIWHPLSGGDG